MDEKCLKNEKSKVLIIKDVARLYGFDKNLNFFKRDNCNIIIKDGKIFDIIELKDHDSKLHAEIYEKRLKDHSGASVDEVSVINAKGQVVFPSFVDPHTHLIYYGDRASEFFMRNRRIPYMEIAERGGGIASSVKQTRSASDEQLLLSLLKRLKALSSFGVSHVEIKSGYGLTKEDELRLLRIINNAKCYTNMIIQPTCMAAHDFPPEAKNDAKLKEKWISEIEKEILPSVKDENLSEFFDIFSEEKVYNLKQTERLCKAALDLGFKLKLHVDEITNIGACQLAVKLKARSVEHLLKITEDEILLLKESETIPVLLPGTAFYLNEPYAPYELFEKNGVEVALASDSNPGSNCTENMLLIYTIAAIKLHMPLDVILKAATVTASKASDFVKPSGIIDKGECANLIIAEIPHLEYLFYHYGDNPIKEVIIEGKKAFVNIDM